MTRKENRNWKVNRQNQGENMYENDEINKHLDEQASQIDQEVTETPGAAIEVDPDLADHMGAFEETALTLEDAEDASFDVDEEQTEER